MYAPEQQKSFTSRLEQNKVKLSERDLQASKPASALHVNNPGDPYEREADRLAAEVAKSNFTSSKHTSTHIQHLAKPTNECREDAPESVQQLLSYAGQPLERKLQKDMEQRFGHDFSNVRVHTGTSAQNAAKEVGARAYTVGQNIVFGANEYAPNTMEGKQLIAHELTHVLQQTKSGQQMLQQDRQRATTRREKVEAAMNSLKAKYGLSDVLEENGAQWTEVELKRIDTSFLKLSLREKDMLRGVSIVRTDSLSMQHQGRRINLSGMTIGGGLIKYTQGGTSGTTPLHEVGHLIHHKMKREAELKLHNSKTYADMESAFKKYEDITAKHSRLFPDNEEASQAIQYFQAAQRQVNKAAADFLDSDDDNLKSKQTLLNDAKIGAEASSLALESYANDAAAKKALEIYEHLMQWVASIEHWMTEKEKALAPQKNLTEFVDIVTKHKLARRGFAPFTPYVASFWPDKPGEFFSESFAVWKNNPGYMKRYAKPLFDWFEKGGHLGPRNLYKDFRLELRDKAPVFDELLNEAEATFLPPFREAKRMLVRE